ncbi:MAG: Exonuclease large subunit, partial [Clostridiales bacterium]|nr:Exonuclease large subunit [Clostridiales bacterium]MDN5282675.1 Exonuclease large subunit [Candidatus Ozemobacter sp.]
KHAVLHARLTGLNPYVLLKRGYIMATDSEGRVKTSVEALNEKEKLILQFFDGTAKVTVDRLIKEKNECPD